MRTRCRPAARLGEQPTTADHWHRTEDETGRPYRFVDAEQLLIDFFAEVRRVLAERDISDAVVRVTETRRP